MSNLTPSDLRKLAESYITPEIAEAAGIFRVDSQGAADLLGRGKPKRGVDWSGIAFPYKYPPGLPLPSPVKVRDFRIRLDNPEIKNGKEDAKYLATVGSRNKFYFTYTTKADWFTDASIPAVFVEGEKKAEGLQRFFDESGEAVFVIGLSGVANWQGRIGKKVNGNGAREDDRGPISDFGLTTWPGRIVDIIFDAKPHKDGQVIAQAKNLAKHLRSLGATARILEMPHQSATGAKGIDDLLYLRGADYVAEWLDRARQSLANKTAKVKIAGFTFTADAKGVFAQPLDETGNASGAPVPVCSPLFIEAITRDEHAGNFGRLLRFTDPDRNEKQWAMPASLLSGDKATYESYLRDQGVDIFHPKHLHTYLASKSDKRVLVVSRTGWHKGAFVFADECIGSDDGETIFHQSPEGGNHLMQTAGALEDWKENVARYCTGNSRLILAIATGFAAALLEKLKVESGGFQLRGGTSTGKTTALFVGGSVWGGGSDKGFLRRWRATINGLESVAASHNDALLCLDELAEVDPWQAGETAYMLANGQGKIRQTKNITLRKPLEWRTLFLSSGEISLADHLATVGKKTRGGMEVRLIDLPADAGQGWGAWENLHDFKSAKEFADHLQEAAKTYYGTAAREFIRRLIEQPTDELRKSWRVFRDHFLKAYCPVDAKEEVGRVCDRFALVAFAGEMATEVSITGWNKGDATKAIANLFKEWLTARGPGRSDEDAAIRQVRLFLEQHADSRFRRLGEWTRTVINQEGKIEQITEKDRRTIANQAGYLERDNEDGITTVYVLPEVFRAEVCKGYDAQMTANALKSRGWLYCDHGLQTQKRTPDGKKKLFAIRSGIFGE